MRRRRAGRCAWVSTVAGRGAATSSRKGRPASESLWRSLRWPLHAAVRRRAWPRPCVGLALYNTLVLKVRAGEASAHLWVQVDPRDAAEAQQVDQREHQDDQKPGGHRGRGARRGRGGAQAMSRRLGSCAARCGRGTAWCASRRSAGAPPEVGVREERAQQRRHVDGGLPRLQLGGGGCCAVSKVLLCVQRQVSRQAVVRQALCGAAEGRVE